MRPSIGDILQTSRDYTGQRRDGTGLLYYGARYYDPTIAKFISPDPIVPGVASSTGGAVTLGYNERMALAPLTVDFHEPQFVDALSEEVRFTAEQGFWFQLDEEERQDAKVSWGPGNPQALNRYAYVLNNPVRYTDPTGHCGPYQAICDQIVRLAQQVMQRAAPYTPRAMQIAQRWLNRAGMAAQAADRYVKWAFYNAMNPFQVVTKPTVYNPALQNAANQLFRPGDTLLGGTAGAIRREIWTGMAIGGRYHLIKGQEMSTYLRRILANEPLSPGDRAIAQMLLDDLTRAFSYSAQARGV